MRTYEALYIVSPVCKDDEIQTVASATEKLVTDNGGAIVRSETWGKRKLAYTVKQFTEGVYILLRFTAQPEFITRLEGYFRLEEKVIRHLVVHFDEQTLRLEAEQEERKEADLQTGGRSRFGRREDDSGDARPARVGSRTEEQTSAEKKDANESKNEEA